MKHAVWVGAGKCGRRGTLPPRLGRDLVRMCSMIDLEGMPSSGRFVMYLYGTTPEYYLWADRLGAHHS